MSSAPKVSEAEADLRVAAREDVAAGVVTLTLVDPAGGELPGWTPGAHVDLVLDDDITRQYSLCSSPGDLSSWRVGVLLDPASRGGSKHVHEKLEQGQTVRVRGPRNHFKLASADSYVFIAGGIGITPLMPMIEAADADDADWRLLYGGRELESMAFVDVLAQHGERVTIWPQDEKGLLELDDALSQPDENTLVYCCGPEPLLDAVEKACADWPRGALHVERFSAKSSDGDADEDGALATFEVVCQRSGQTFTIQKDQTILGVLGDAGISTTSSCQEGICGTCETAVLDGEPDHRDSVLDDDEKAENDAMMICISRSRSETLVLDI